MLVELWLGRLDLELKDAGWWVRGGVGVKKGVWLLGSWFFSACSVVMGLLIQDASCVDPRRRACSLSPCHCCMSLPYVVAGCSCVCVTSETSM
jgi:hypothetical protein